MFLRLVLLALALCFACAAARPHHLSPLEHDLADLEQGLDKIIDLEEDDEDEDEDEDDAKGEGPFLIALDCGSSGTKVMLFAKHKDHCPPISKDKSYELVKYVKYVPTMTDGLLADNGFRVVFGRSEPNTPNRLERTSIGVLPIVQQNTVGVLAMATAGNRIKTPEMNRTAWNALDEALRQSYPAMYEETAVTSISRTIPGTHEAWYEMKTNNGRNFISMGGASAQFGVLLRTDKMVSEWAARVVRSETSELDKQTLCNNQNKISDFITTVASSEDTSYTPLGQTVEAIEGACQVDSGETGKCIGLVSWLAVETLGGSEDCPAISGDSPLYSHYVGGVANSKALIKQREYPNCFVNFDAVGCAYDHFRFSRQDRLMNIVQEFMNTVRNDFVTEDGFYAMAVLVDAVKEYNNLGSDAAITHALRDDEDKATFALWGAVGLIFASRVVENELSDSSDVAFRAITIGLNDRDWMRTAANLVKHEGDPFTVQCKIPFKAEKYKDTTAQTKDGFVYLGRELATD